MNYTHPLLGGAQVDLVGWLWLVGSIKIWVSFAEEPYKTDDILQKRPIILGEAQVDLILPLCVYQIHTLWWLRLVGSIKIHVSFAKEPYKRDDILQKRPII